MNDDSDNLSLRGPSLEEALPYLRERAERIDAKWDQELAVRQADVKVGARIQALTIAERVRMFDHEKKTVDERLDDLLASAERICAWFENSHGEDGAHS